MTRARSWLRSLAAIVPAGPARLLGASLGFAAACAGAQPVWNTIGPAGGTVSALVASPVSAAAVYAATPENGIFYTADAGRSWNAANTGLVPSADSGRVRLLAVSALASDGRFVYAATAGGLYASNASAPGLPQWTVVAAPGGAPKITLLAFDPASRRLFAASDATDGINPPRVYSTAVGAAAAPSAPGWVASALPATTIGASVGALAVVPSPGPGTQPALLVAVGNGVQAAPILAQLPDLVWADADPGGALAAGVVNAIAYSPDFSRAYACSGSIVFQSGNPLDVQPLWLPADVQGGSAPAFTCTAFLSVPIAAGGAPHLMLGTDQGAFVSSDGTRFDATAALGVGAAANAFARVDPGSGTELMVGGGFGIASAPVSALAPALAWTARNGPPGVAAGGGNQRLNNASVVDTAVLGGTLYAAVATNHYRELLASSDGGATWSATGIGAVLSTADAPTRLAADAANGVLYVASTQGLLAYTPAASRWTIVGAPTIDAVSAMAIGAAKLFVGTDHGLYAVPLGGNPGAALPVAAGLAAFGVKALLVAGATVYAGTLDSAGESAVASASEAAAAAGNATWNAFGSAPFGPGRITSLLLAGERLLAASNGGLVRYATAASPWASVNTGADPATQIADAFGVVNALFSDGVTVFAATGSNGVYSAPFDNPFFWTPFNGSGGAALPTLEVRSLRAGGTLLYAATRAGIAVFDGVVAGPAPPPPPPPPPAPGGSSGGGAVDARYAALLLAAIGALALLRRGR